jgi:predicted AAA+ superfamily ATPase
MTTFLNRLVANNIAKSLSGGKSVLLLGPRQVGKSTLIKEALAKNRRLETILLQNPRLRQLYENDPGRLIQEYELEKSAGIIFIDEVQKIPALFDSVQYLIDEQKKQFILTGSSARKLRRAGVNLLPGRLILHRLDPLMWAELGLAEKNLVPSIGLTNINRPSDYQLEDCLVFGTLPEIVSLNPGKRRELLQSYVTIYLEEEIRAEALSRNVGRFGSFLQLAAQESGANPNFAKLSNQTGISVLTIREYYQILTDTLVIHRLPPYIKNTRKRLTKTPRHYFFDLGVRNALAEIPLETKSVNADKGRLFEHFVVLEMFRRQHLAGNFQLYYWRTLSGLEVDLIIQTPRRLIPIEIKAAKNIRAADLSGLKAFLGEHRLKQGYVVSLDEKPYRLDQNITVIPWNYC